MIGVGAAWAFLGTPLGRIAGVAGALAIGAAVGFWRGDAHGDRQCEARIAESIIETQRLDRERIRQFQERAAAAELETQLSMQKAEERLDEYRRRLKKNPGCAATGDDVEFLR